MENDLVRYVREYQYTLKERPFSEVDSLVLSQLSYLKMLGIVPKLGDDLDFLPFAQMADKKFHRKLFADKRYREDNKALVEAILQSRRFKSLELNYFVDVLDRVMEIQFSAITFRLDKEVYYIAFRGTDENLVGWKEDFTLAFSEPVPGQLFAAKYVRKAGEKIPGDFYVGGHSKGGNLAIFAAMSVSKSLQKRMISVYSHDGPGCKKEVLERYHYEKIMEKVKKTIPVSSLVGMLMEQDERCEVIESHGLGPMQHNPFTWKIKDGRFVEGEKLHSGAKIMDQAVNDWIVSLQDEQIAKLADILFDLLDMTNSDNLIDLTENWKNSLPKLIHGVQEMDPESKEIAEEIIRKLVHILEEKAKFSFRKKIGIGVDI